MFTFMIVLSIWIIGIFAMWMWDAFIGFGIDFDDNQNPPLFIVCFFWGICLPIILLVTFDKWLNKIKNKRLTKEKEQEKIRISFQKELDTYLAQVDEELEIRKTSHTLKVK